MKRYLRPDLRNTFDGRSLRGHQIGAAIDKKRKKEGSSAFIKAFRHTCREA